ncbi:hypothetical protein [Dokdonella soli]|uniref:hypothetical protein n=1 Tax=Dokdonella soli TaxID=529810 RepID=UPI0031D9F991
MTPSFASSRFRLSRLAHLRVLRLLAFALAMSMFVNGIAASAIPFVSAGVNVGDMHHAAASTHCAHPDQMTPRSAHADRHAGDCPCCLGKVCACGFVCAGWIASPMASVMVLPRTAAPVANATDVYAMVTSRLLRPPIA